MGKNVALSITLPNLSNQSTSIVKPEHDVSFQVSLYVVHSPLKGVLTLLEFFMTPVRETPPLRKSYILGLVGLCTLCRLKFAGYEPNLGQGKNSSSRLYIRVFLSDFTRAINTGVHSIKPSH